MKTSEKVNHQTTLLAILVH